MPEEKQQELSVMDVNGTLFIVPDWEGLITFVLLHSVANYSLPAFTQGGRLSK